MSSPSSDGLVPILINLDGQSRINNVALADTNVDSFDDLCASLYTALRPSIPDFYYDEAAERSITQLYVQWAPYGDRFLPSETEITEANMKAVLRILALRRGQDMIRCWLNEV